MIAAVRRRRSELHGHATTDNTDLVGRQGRTAVSSNQSGKVGIRVDTDVVDRAAGVELIKFHHNLLAGRSSDGPFAVPSSIIVAGTITKEGSLFSRGNRVGSSITPVGRESADDFETSTKASVCAAKVRLEDDGETISTRVSVFVQKSRCICRSEGALNLAGVVRVAIDTNLVESLFECEGLEDELDVKSRRICDGGSVDNPLAEPIISILRGSLRLNVSTRISNIGGCILSIYFYFKKINKKINLK